jgi:hypothetical protein
LVLQHLKGWGKYWVLKKVVSILQLSSERGSTCIPNCYPQNNT